MVDSVVENKSHKRNARIIWLAVIVAALIIFGMIGWFVFSFLGEEEEPQPTIVPQTTQATQSATPSSQIAETKTDEELLKEVVSKKTGIALDKIDFEVSKNTGKYAKGLVGAKGEEVGGGYWLAVKVSDEGAVVFDGQNTPECSIVNPHDFPADMVPECYDSSGNVVTRK